MREPNPSPSAGSFETSAGSLVPMIEAPITSLQSLAGTDGYQQKVNDTLILTHTPRCLRWSSFLPSGITSIPFYQEDPGEDELR